MSRIAEILDFWFAPGMADQWFKKDPAFDQRVREHFFATYEKAVAGALESWRDSAEGCVALCLLLDQAPRNLFREDLRAFASDEQARAVTRHALAQGFDKDLTQAQRLFLYLPLEHCENLADQEDAVRLIGALDENPDWVTYTVQHRDIIARFGRFPHRNDVLGRATTPAEAAFLTQPGSSF